jgi:hypothetical protein
MDVGGVGRVEAERAVLVAKGRAVAVGMEYVRLSMFEGSKVLVIASMAIGDATVVTTRRLVRHMDLVLERYRC